MFERRSLRFPITLGVTLILIIVALTVGWVLLSISGATNRQPQYYWTMVVGREFAVPRRFDRRGHVFVAIDQSD